jgi:hypothetical protein
MATICAMATPESDGPGRDAPVTRAGDAVDEGAGDAGRPLGGRLARFRAAFVDYARSTYGALALAWASRHPDLSGFVLLWAGSALVYHFTSDTGRQPQDYFSRLAEAFLNGRYWITDAPPWLAELIPLDAARWIVPYPPMPAILALPFVAIFGVEFPPQTYSAFYAGLAVGVVYLALGRLGVALRARARLGLSLVFAFGTVFWFVAVSGSAWYFAHVSAVLLFSVSLLAALTRRPAWIAGLFLGLAALARLPVGLALPLVAAAQVGLPGLRDLRTIDRGMVLRNAVLFAVGLGIPALAYAAFNELRWGTVLDQAYVRIPHVLEDPIYAKHGILSAWYIPRNVFAILFRSWNYVDDAPWLQPSWWGLGLFFTTPLLLWMFRARLRDPRVAWSVLAIALVCVPVLTHGNVGISQFGYRFSLDFQVPMFVILATVLARQWSRVAKAAAVASIVICAYALWAVSIGFVAY